MALGGSVVSGASGGVNNSVTGPAVESEEYVVVHRSSEAADALEIGRLLPNTLYHFRLRHVSSQATSNLSPATRVYTPPLPPFAPVAVDVQVRKRKW